MKKSNIESTVLFNLTTTTYNKKGQKWIEVEKETEEVNGSHYNNVINSKEFFKNLGGYERHEKSYTTIGYIVTTVTSISPDKQTRIIRHFDTITN